VATISLFTIITTEASSSMFVGSLIVKTEPVGTAISLQKDIARLVVRPSSFDPSCMIESCDSVPGLVLRISRPVSYSLIQ